MMMPMTIQTLKCVSWQIVHLRVEPSPSLPRPRCFPAAHNPAPLSELAGISPPLTEPCSTCWPLSSSLWMPTLAQILPQTPVPCTHCLDLGGSSHSVLAPAGMSPHLVRRVPLPLQVWWPPFSHQPTGTPNLVLTTRSHTNGSSLLFPLIWPRHALPLGGLLLQWWWVPMCEQEAAGSQKGCGGLHRTKAPFCWRQRLASPTYRQ